MTDEQRARPEVLLAKGLRDFARALRATMEPTITFTYPAWIRKWSERRSAYRRAR